MIRQNDIHWFTSWEKTKSKMLDEDLLAKYVTEPVYEKLKAFAKENDLKFRKRDDFLKILEFYTDNFIK